MKFLELIQKAQEKKNSPEDFTELVEQIREAEKIELIQSKQKLTQAKRELKSMITELVTSPLVPEINEFVKSFNKLNADIQVLELKYNYLKKSMKELFDL